MSLSQTYFVAGSARSKLGKEACRPDHDLRLLVGHANLLDSLMVELADAEKEQEKWFHQTVSKNQKADQPRHVQWVDTIVNDSEEDEDDEDTSDSGSDSDSESDIDEEFDMVVPLRRVRSPPICITTHAMDEDEEYYDEEDDDDHALTRTISNTTPPELVHDEESSDDESPPSSPPQMMDLEYSEKDRQAITTTSFYDQEESRSASIEDSYFVPERNAPLIPVQ